MPTVLRFGAFRVMIYLNDHRPAHVHVIAGENSAIYNLNCPAGPAELRHNFGLSTRELRDARDGLVGQVEMLCSRWREIYGEH
jgi:hypothetical protein